MIQPLNNVAGCIQEDGCVRIGGAKESPLEHVPKIPAAAGAQHGANEMCWYDICLSACNPKACTQLWCHSYLTWGIFNWMSARQCQNQRHAGQR